MANLSIRGLDEETAARLKAAAQARGVSVNRHALDLLRRGLGLLPRTRSERHHDLDHLAGTWTAEDTAELAKALAAFEHIDDELWR
jgi:plasmid stability protein